MRAHAWPSRRFLFVVGDNRFEKISKTLVPFGVVLAGDLQQQFLERVEAAQRVARDRIGEPRSEHYKLLLAFALGRADGAAHRVVEAPQLALGARIHVAHAAHHGMGLVVKVERITHQFLDVDLRRAIEAATISAVAAVTPIAARTALATLAMRSAAWSAFARSAAPAAALAVLVFCLRVRHLVPLSLKTRARHSNPRSVRLPHHRFSVERRAHSRATRPEGRSFRFVRFFPARSATRLVRAF